MSNNKQLGISSLLYNLPLIRGLEKERTALRMMTESPGHQAMKLRSGDLNAAFLSMIEYARDASEYYIVPSVAVSSHLATDTVVLHFRKELRDIKTLAADPAFVSEIVLARIVLREQFGVGPSIVPVAQSLASMLARADAALLVGDTAMRESPPHPQKIDLVEEWFEMTDLPFVHGIWCGRENALTASEIGTIQNSRSIGDQNLERIAQSTANDDRSADTILHYLESFSYNLTDEVKAGIEEFLHYAYYQGVLPDVPDLQFYPPDSSSQSPGKTFSLN